MTPKTANNSKLVLEYLFPLYFDSLWFWIKKINLTPSISENLLTIHQGPVDQPFLLLLYIFRSFSLMKYCTERRIDDLPSLILLLFHEINSSLKNTTFTKCCWTNSWRVSVAMDDRFFFRRVMFCTNIFVASVSH